MYLQYYNLDQEPFHVTPDPEFLYLSKSHKEALGSLMYGIEKKKGFVAITGCVGVGKTTMVRSYIEQAGTDNLKVIYVFNPNLSFKELLLIMYGELALPIPDTPNLVDLVTQLHLGLIEHYKKGNTVALIVDEAQNMPIETLENLRMLSNLETAKEKLIQIVLVGQPEFDEILNRPDLKQLQQRISVRTSITPLSTEEGEDYIHHRLSKAGLIEGQLFNGRALRLIVREAQGIPRIINILCDSALVTGCGYQKKVITRSIVKEVIKDFQGTRKADSTPRLIAGPRFSWMRPLAVTSATVFVLLAFLSVGLFVQQQRVADDPPAIKPVKEVVEALPQVRPTQDTVIVTKKGDTLSHLMLQAYKESELRNYGNTALLRMIVKRNNIANGNRIEIGQTIVFPRTGTSAGQ
jgi:general secretion pathway protein A